jgi:hypothetical protein
MNTDSVDAFAQPRGATLPKDRSHHLRQGWRVITTLLVLAVFIEAVFAGAMLSGVAWARNAHSINAAILVLSTIAAGLVSIVTLRHFPHGRKLGVTLLSMSVVILLQAAVGAMSAKGANLMWIHVPLGVAVFGLPDTPPQAHDGCMVNKANHTQRTVPTPPALR